MTRQDEAVAVVLAAMTIAMREAADAGRPPLPPHLLVGAAVKTAWQVWEETGLITPEPLPSRGDPQYRYCVHCGVDCDPDDPYAPDPTHMPECPEATGVHVMTERDMRCWSCRVTRMTLECGRCHEEFRVGDAYARVQLAEDVVEDGQTDGVVTTTIVCLGCAALASIGGAP